LVGQPVEVRQIDGVDAREVLAVSQPGGRCNDGDSVLSPWSFAISAHASDVTGATCSAEVDTERVLDSCPPR
jgi:hypothetical protein